MADDTLELIEPIFENNPRACPKNMLPYEEGVLLPKQQKAVNSIKVPTVRENQEYLASHPEVHAIVTLLLRAVFARRPKNIPEFMGNFMARQEVGDEIDKYLDKEMHTVVGRGADEPHREESKRYRFLDEDDEHFLSRAPEAAKEHHSSQKKAVCRELKASISEHIHDEDVEGYRMSVISDVGIKLLSATFLEESDDTSAEQTGLRTLMAPRTDSSTHTDSLGTCSLLDELGDSEMARSISADHQMVLGEGNNEVYRGRSDDDVGSAFGDQLNDEILMRMPKRNLSGVSAISDQGIFKAVEVEDVEQEGGKREKRRTVFDGARGASPIREEDEEQSQ